MPYYIASGLKDPPMIWDDEYWQEEWGTAYEEKRPFLIGEPINPEFMPSSGYLDRKTAILPSLKPGRWMCDEEVRKVIEDIEPGVHRFLPYKVRKNKTSDEVVKEYFIINICNSLEVFDPERTDPDLFELKVYPNGKSSLLMNHLNITLTRHDKSRKINIAVNEAAMDGKHLVVDRRIARSKFMSDAMYEALRPYMNEPDYFRAIKTV